MVRALLAGQKTVTRRIVKPAPTPDVVSPSWLAAARSVCPYGAPDDLLWVRETWRADDYDAAETIYRADMPADALAETKGIILWRPSIYMPRGRSRITMRIVDVRAERLSMIDPRDAEREGVRPSQERSARGEFAELWDAINGKRAPWSSDPWVWRVEFERIEGGTR